jgi:hypothetical protein
VGIVLGAALAGSLALSMCAGAAEAATITSTGSVTLENYYAKAELQYTNCPDSSSACGTFVTSPDYTIERFVLNIPGVSLPAGSTITSASLTYDLPYLVRDGVANLESFEPVDPNASAHPPVLYAMSALVALPMSLTSDGVTYTFPYNGPGSRGDLDLLAAGFGSQILAGDPLAFGGRAEPTQITWGFRTDDDHPFADTGYNADSSFLLYVGFPSTPAAATLEVTYELAAVPEPSAWATMLAGLAAIGAALRARRRRTYTA